MKGQRWLGTALAVALCAPLLGCASSQERIEMAGGGRRVSAEQIEADPWGLLPGGALLWMDLELPALLQAEYGPPLLEQTLESLPLSRGRGIDFGKDVTRVRAGLYASQTGDLAAILEGRFDPKAVESLVAADPVTKGGEKIEHSQFAGFDVLHAGAWSMAFVTEHFVAVGTGIGVRRVLERVEEGRVRRALPAWFDKMLSEQKASLWLGVDLDAQPVPATLRSELDFLESLRGARVVGSFEGGLRLAGSFSYDSPTEAAAARESIESKAAELGRAALLLAVLKVPRPLRRLETEANGESVQFVAEFDGRAVAMGVSYLGQLRSQIGLR
jgi:hypothetical protein